MQLDKDKVLALRMKAKLTTTQVGAAIGKGSRTIENIESGKGTTLLTANNICTFFDVSLDYLALNAKPDAK